MIDTDVFGNRVLCCLGGSAEISHGAASRRTRAWFTRWSGESAGWMPRSRRVAELMEEERTRILDVFFQDGSWGFV